MLGEIAIEAAKGALVGGIIGYATNRLAVSMLFRPLQPWRVFGWQVPLTPGLVVKNRQRLAEAVGRSVGEDLLDPDTLLHHLREAKLREPVEEALVGQLELLSGDDRPVAVLLGREKAEALAAHGAQMLGGAVAAGMESGEVSEFLSQAMEPLLARSAAEILGAEGLEKAAGAIMRGLGEAVGHPQVGGAVESLLEEALERAFDESALEEFSLSLKESVSHVAPVLAERIQQGIADHVASDDFGVRAREKVSGRLTEIILSRFPMAAMFVNDGLIGELLANRWDGVVEELEELALSEELHAHLVEKLEEQAGALGERLAAFFREPETRRRIAGWGAREIVEGAPRLFGSAAVRPVVTAALAQWAERPVGSYFGGSPREAGGVLVDGLLEWLRGEAGRRNLMPVVEAGLRRALETVSVADTAGLLLQREGREQLAAVASWVEDKAMEQAPALLSERFHIREIVTGKIADFEARELEATIHRVSGRELRGIIRLGGMIGICVGAVAQVVNFLLT